MKSKIKSKTSILITLGILFAISLLSSYNKYEINSESVNLKISVPSGGININGNSEWADFKDAGKCIGHGTYSDPYIIEDLEIDGESISISNSDVHFKIEGCTIDSSSISLGYVDNAKLINNTADGISLLSSNNNTILGNIINLPSTWAWGITIEGDDNIISGNTVNSDINYDRRVGITLMYSRGNNLSGNIMNDCGLEVFGYWANLDDLISFNIDSTNLVNGKSLYYYTNEKNLGVNNFTNVGQVFLVNCSNSLISNVSTSYCPRGITLFSCNNNNISGNTASNNEVGIYLVDSNENNITGNDANHNTWSGIDLERSDNNFISGNAANDNIDQYGSFGFGIYF